jgi:ABC-type polysaccharide/polyol phosphate export permease
MTATVERTTTAAPPAAPESPQTMVLRSRPDPLGAYAGQVWRHRSVLAVLIRKDFQTRYKRASFGVLWALVVPALQASVLALVFSHVIRTGTGAGFPVYIISGVVAYSYFALVLPSACTSVVDNAALTDKVWFPRVLLVVVPCVSNLVGLVISLAVMLAIMPAFGVGIGVRTLLLAPAVALLLMFSLALGLVTSALHVYFRDVKFLVQAALMVWMYATPIVYPEKTLGHLRLIVNLNPLSGVVALFHEATVGYSGEWAGTLAVTGGATAALLAVGVAAHWWHDRLFVDRL